MDGKRVGIVDEEEVFRRGLVACLREDPLLIVAWDVPETAPPSGPLDVVVASLRALQREKFSCPVVLCAGRSDFPLLAQSPGGNTALAVVQRHLLTAESLTATVRAVAAGFRVDHPKPDTGRSRLDDKRRQILRLLAQGAATRDISKTLCYSERTIKALIQDVARELRAETRAQAVAEAIRQGLI